MQKPAETAVPIHPLLASRWSPRAYDETYQISETDLLAILEAGRWAPSSNNLQPWFFSIARHGDELFERISHEGLNGFNAAWAPRASAYLVISATTTTAEGEPYRPAPYDCGLAAMSMIFEAESRGITTHQIGGFNRETLPFILGLPETVTPQIVITLGKAASPEILEGGAKDRETAPRQRKSLDEIVLHGAPKL